jgi:hypothetical protein
MRTIENRHIGAAITALESEMLRDLIVKMGPDWTISRVVREALRRLHAAEGLAEPEAARELRRTFEELRT